MTRKSMTLSTRAVFLSLVLVMSVVAMPFAGTAMAASGDKTVANGEHVTVWQGESLVYTGASAEGDQVILRQVDSDGNPGKFVKEYSADAQTDVKINTGELGLEGKYAIMYDTDSTKSGLEEAATFEVFVQDLSVSTEDAEGDKTNTVNNATTGGNKLTFNLNSNRAGYTVYVTEDSLNASELLKIFGGTKADNIKQAENLENYNQDVYVYDVTSPGELTGDFSDVSSGTYNFQFDVADTSASATQKVNVVNSDGANASFNKSVYTEQAGDKFVFTVNTENTSSFQVRFGDKKDDGYTQTATVSVEDSDSSTVKMVFDTYHAGESNTKPFSIHEDSQDVATITSQDNDTNLASPPLDASQYYFKLSTMGTVTDISAVNLQEPSTSGATTYIAPNATDLNTLEDIKEAKDLTEANTVAKGDKFVFEFNASGLYAYLDDYTAGELEKGGALDSEAGVYVKIEETNPDPNTDAKTLNLSNGTLITDGENNRFYLVFDESAVDIKADSEYKASLHITEDSPYVEDSTTADNEKVVSTNVTVVEQKVTFQNMNSNDYVEVTNDKKATVTATTTLAPGTETTLIAQSLKNAENPFSKMVEVTVSDNRKISTTFDMSIANVGQEFTLQARGYSDKVDAVVVEGGPTTYDFTVNVEDQNGNTVDASVTINGTTKKATDGTATFKLQAGSYSVSATAKGYQDLSKSVSVSEGGENSTTLTLSPTPETYDVTVNVTNENGDAVNGASVTLDGKTKTVEGGSVTFTVKSGSYTANVSADGYDSASKSIDVSSNTSTTVTLTKSTPETVTRTVTVTNANGEPIKGATVSAGDTTATTNENGKATLKVQKGTESVTVSAEGYKEVSKSLSQDTKISLTASNSSGGSTGGSSGGSGGLGTIGLVLVVAAILIGGGIIFYYQQNN